MTSQLYVLNFLPTRVGFCKTVEEGLTRKSINTNINQMERVNWIILILSIIFISSCKEDVPKTAQEAEPVTDIEGNTYRTVKIGDKIWMAENLKTTTYNDGTPIEYVTNQTIWTNLNSGAYCWYDNKTSYKYEYGALYNWFAVNSEKLAPDGWHIPSKKEFDDLYKNGLTPENVFNSIFGGGRGVPVAHGKPNYIFENIEIMGYWWTSTKSEYSPLGAYFYRINRYDISGYTSYGYPQPGYSVRCVKD